MRYIPFGESKEKLSEIVLGLMRIGPGKTTTQSMSVQEVEFLLDTAFDAGINMLDNADIYANGACEKVLGEVFAARPNLRQKFFLQTKCGIVKDPDITYFDFSKEHILESVDNSLLRMQTDHIDSLLLHRPDALMEPEEIAEAFAILKTAGKVRNFGLSNCSPMMIERLQKVLTVPVAADQIQLSAAFTPAIDADFNFNTMTDAGIMRDGGIIEYCGMNDIVIQAWSVMQYGFFEGVFLGSEKYPALNRVIDRIAEEKGVTNTAVALAWILRLPVSMQAVIGTTKPQRIRDSAAAASFTLTRKEWYEIYLAAGNILP